MKTTNFTAIIAVGFSGTAAMQADHHQVRYDIERDGAADWMRGLCYKISMEPGVYLVRGEVETHDNDEWEYNHVESDLLFSAIQF